jgi:hypothetical protein
MSDQLKVYSAAVLGALAPGANLFLDGIAPVLKCLLLVGQIAVAVITALYIYSKWKKNRKSK